MSNSSRHLSEWLRKLFSELQKYEPHRARFIARIAGDRIARVGLDDEFARITFKNEKLSVRKVPSLGRDDLPWGQTDTATVLALLSGYTALSDALAEGTLELQGSTEDVVRICHIIEVLVDASTRIPAMQQLSAELIDGWSPAPARQQLKMRSASKQQLRDAEKALLNRERL